MSPLHPLLEKQRKKVQREQRGWILIAVGVCLMHCSAFSTIWGVYVTLQTNSHSQMKPMPFYYVLETVVLELVWWFPLLSSWTLATLVCRLRGLATFRGEGILLLTIAFVIAPIDVAMCVYVVNQLFSPPQVL